MKNLEFDDLLRYCEDLHFVKYHQPSNSSIFTGTIIEDGITSNLIVKIKSESVTDLEQLEGIENLTKIFENERFKKFNSLLPTGWEVTTVYPALPEDMIKYVHGKSSKVLESYETYRDEVYPQIKDQDLSWMYSILDGNKEQDDILYQDEYFVLMPDLKWDRKVENLYCLAIVRDRSLRSIRDLTRFDIPLLEHIYKKGIETISKLYGYKKRDLRIYFHYHPSFWHLHIHFNLVKNSYPGSSIDYAIPLVNVITNLKLVSDYYQKVSFEVMV